MRRWLSPAFAALVLCAGVSPVPAQQAPFLSELLAQYARFKSLYAQKKLSGTDLSAIERLRVRNEAAFRSGAIPAILETLAEAVSFLEGKPWNQRRRFETSLTLEIDRLVVEPNEVLQVSLTRMFPSDDRAAFSERPTATFEIRRQTAAPATDRTALLSPQRMPRQLVLAQRLAVGETNTIIKQRLLLPDGTYSLVARVEAGPEAVIELERPIYAISDFSERTSELSAAVEQIKKSSDPKVKAVADRVSTPEFQLQRLISLTSSRGTEELDPFAELDKLEKITSALAGGSDPFAPLRGEVEQACRAADGQLIPYRLFIPNSYDSARAAPLLVLLHGGLGDERSYFSDLYDSTLIKSEAERRGFILAAPNGRARAGGFTTQGADDVLQVVNWVSRYYKVDPGRIYLSGHSTGGFATWLVASRQPDLFAGIAAISAGAPVPADKLSALLQKLHGLPALVVHGARDGIVSPSLSRDMVSTAKKAGLSVEHLEVPDADHLSVVAATFARVMDFFDRHKKPDK